MGFDLQVLQAGDRFAQILFILESLLDPMLGADEKESSAVASSAYLQISEREACLTVRVFWKVSLFFSLILVVVS